MLIGLLKLAGQAAVIVLIVALLAAWPCWHYSKEPIEAVKTMVAAGGVCLAATIIGLIPLVIAWQRRADWLGQACLGATVLRLLATFLIGALTYLALQPNLTAFALWTMMFYLVLLAWETKTAVKFIRIFYHDAATPRHIHAPDAAPMNHTAGDRDEP